LKNVEVLTAAAVIDNVRTDRFLEEHGFLRKQIVLVAKVTYVMEFCNLLVSNGHKETLRNSKLIDKLYLQGCLTRYVSIAR
jgi:hypothetical protein